MTGLDWGEAVESYKGKTLHTPGIAQYFQVCASRKKLYKKIINLKPKGKTLFQKNEVHFRYKSKATTITLREHLCCLWRERKRWAGEPKSRSK